MKNILEIDGYRAVIQFDPEIEMFRGEFTDLNGGADFYADNIEALKMEAKTSLEAFLGMCAEDGVEPRKSFSGKFNLRIDPKTHGRIVAAATAEGISLNQWVSRRLEESL